MKPPFLDSAFVDLPHPVRVDAAFGQDMETAVFPGMLWSDLRPLLVDSTHPTEWLLNFADGLYELAALSHGLGSTVNLGLPDAEIHQQWERTELLRQIQRLGPKKAARLLRKLPGKYDRIIIGNNPIANILPTAHRASLVWADGLNPLQQIVGWLHDFQEFLCGDLGRSGIRVVGKLNGSPFEALAPKFFAQSQSQHHFRPPSCAGCWMEPVASRLAPSTLLDGCLIRACLIQTWMSVRTNRHVPPSSRITV